MQHSFNWPCLSNESEKATGRAYLDNCLFSGEFIVSCTWGTLGIPMEKEGCGMESNCMHILCLSKLLLLLFGLSKICQTVGSICSLGRVWIPYNLYGKQRERDGMRGRGSSLRFDCGLGLFSVAVDHLAYANKTCNPIDKYLSSWQRFKRDISTLRPRTVAN